MMFENLLRAKGCGILNTCYGVCSMAEGIDFSKLPSIFIANKTGGGGGENIFIVRDKMKLEHNVFIQELNLWLKDKGAA